MVTPVSPDLSLALGIASSPGVYALLVGSGISRSAGIPTGWEVVVDLVRRLARVEGADPEPDPAKWYSSVYGEPPRYSALLERLGPRAAERQSLLLGYFEATADDRADGIKMPTSAHRAIAELVASNLIRTIVTTNFDRLLESALESAGIAPVVIATADQATGAPPLAHGRCTVIKLHGDYLDARIRNSDDELSSYEAPMDSLLDRIFDDYGLIVCGWSGEYDVALRAALERCKARRYTTYWCVRGDQSATTDALVAHRDAQVIEIRDADSFFTQLLERVTTIRESDERHPIETRVAVETLKRYLPEDRHRIRLRELIREATEELVAHLDAGSFSPESDFSNEELLARTQRLNSLSEASLALTANGCFWGEAKHDDVWLGTVRRLAEFDAPQSGKSVWLGLFRYPALLNLYAAGIAAVAAGRYRLLASLLLAPVRSNAGNGSSTVVQAIFPSRILADDFAHTMFPHPDAPQTTYKTPLSQYLCHTLRPAFAHLVPADQDYTEAFDIFEYVTAIAHQDIGGYFARGCFVWRSQSSEMVTKRIESEQEEWPLIHAGLFGGSLDRALKAKRRGG